MNLNETFCFCPSSVFIFPRYLLDEIFCSENLITSFSKV